MFKGHRLKLMGSFFLGPLNNKNSNNNKDAASANMSIGKNIHVLVHRRCLILAKIGKTQSPIIKTWNSQSSQQIYLKEFIHMIFRN